MTPMMNSVLSFVLLGIGIVASTHILTLLNRHDTSHGRYFRWVHRISGYLFFSLYLFLSVVMFQKLEGLSVLPPKAAIHAYIGIAILPLIIIKIGIARFYKKFYKSLPVYGVILMIAVFLQIPLHAGLYLISTIRSQYIALSDKGRLVRVNIRIGREIVRQKCVICHSLERVYAHVKSEADWRDYVARMRAKDPAFMNDREALNALGYLVKNLGIDETKMDIQVGMRIILEKCHTCHTIERVFTARKTPAEWVKTVELMRSFDPLLLNDFEVRQVNYYLREVLAR
ncbi:MAG: hypothetical protein DCC43_11235 [Candidatus Brocadia sp.]|jgi:mono/diheme cytochrome c family protein/succinate dehydrogenase/fumarate reductase cytochrome b subunit|uniref:Heme protein n=1 Tax=Candidatus Brocadia fulgida TaxID=380242 RepID=A0A0M2V3J7_9BACT|nr:MAG: putative heme protein [Candidatus Brocadia fulgida]MCC6326590.1 hypothetical protein [Candidatus Brocadia sp.]MCE7911950.1 hypothetical protein [Candidatus Brocadia sp. AMX3]OQZ00709.1 MAG: hypothetical protein B6D35_05630 [Candidatus Brocadia sp. UTAMX2]MBV6519383.1 hypothetical protein [Candidatus Brocadia fulgida]